jgi:phospholipid/cholesterol/gamma-HCH transport system substrate-binding protein
MARSLEWSELKSGVVGAIVVASAVIGILFFARVGQLRGDTTTFYVYSDDADGVLPGTEVWLSGEKVGQVKRVHFRPITTDTLRRLSIEAQIIADRMRYIRRDARVDIRPGGNLIGSPVINITGGTSRAPALQGGDTLAAVSSSAFKPLGVKVSSLSERMTLLADTARRLAAIINSTQGTLGAFSKNGLPQMPKATATMNELMTKATRGDGTIGLAMRNDLGARLAKVLASKDSIMALVSSGQGSLGRFRNDSTLMKDVASIQAQLDSLKMRFSGNGTVARARTDSSLTIQMARLKVELSALMADLQKNPKSYIAF